ncbi:MAG: cobalamin biosynthesis protein, partial [Dehalococcoidia bacterium]|nr:cobalamin biosynthesis protein [Dehalococcoidia bacterium]
MGAARQDKTAIIAITKAGAEKGRQLHRCLKESTLYLPEKLRKEQDLEVIGFDHPLTQLLGKVFSEYKRIVLFVSVGAVVRLLAPLIKSKQEDPAVVAVDQEGKFAISLLSGHIGGANALAGEVAAALGGVPVITTASEVSGVVSPDMIGREFGWEIENKENIKFVSAALVNDLKTGVYQDSGERDWLPDDKKPANLVFYDSLEALKKSECRAAIIITDRVLAGEDRSLLKKSIVYRPRSLVAGIGCRRGTSGEEIEKALVVALQENKLAFKSVRNLATVDIKRDEDGLNQAAKKYGWPVEYFSSDELNRFCRNTAICTRS